MAFEAELQSTMSSDCENQTDGSVNYEQKNVNNLEEISMFSASCNGNDLNKSDDEDIEWDTNFEGIPSFVTGNFESQELKALIEAGFKYDKKNNPIEDIDRPIYLDTNVFPKWMLDEASWKKKKHSFGNAVISEILRIPHYSRSQEQSQEATEWLMRSWRTAANMGMKKCLSMLREFKFHTAEIGENIITEGEIGQKFYIVVSGVVSINKAGVGEVGKLTEGKSFGEIALTLGNDKRTATVRAVTRTDLLSLHKNDYEFFVRDLQAAERKEMNQVLISCTLFQSWPKAKIDRLLNSCSRREYREGETIFRQGDHPGTIFIIWEGSVQIIKEIFIKMKNQWPTAVNDWGSKERSIMKPVIIRRLKKGDFFGEVAIIQNCNRTATAVATDKTLLLVIDKLDFVHLASYGNSTFYNTCETDNMMIVLQKKMQTYIQDTDIMEMFADNSHLKGGPNTIVHVGDVKMSKSKLEKKIIFKKFREIRGSRYKKGKGTEKVGKRKEKK